MIVNYPIAIITLLSIVICTAGFADDCIPGKVMKDNHSELDTLSEEVVYSTDIDGYTFKKIPDRNLRMVFVGMDKEVTLSDWCYSPSSQSIKFLSKPLHYWDSKVAEVKNGERLYAFFSPADTSPEVQIALGHYIARDFSQKPLILRSGDQGKSWLYQGSIWNNPWDATDANITNVFCTTGSCIASGNYKNEENRNLYPLLIVTTNNGRSWSYANVAKRDDLDDGRLHSSYCIGDKCIAAGEVGSHYDDYHRLPLIMFSSDKGKSWDKAKIVGINSEDRGVVNAIYCTTDDKCMASGSFIPAKRKKRPLIMLTSTNGGSYWQHNHHITNIPASLMSSTVNEINCNGNFCLAIGNYGTSDNKQLPMLLKTNDAGDNWEFISSISNFPDNYHRSSLNKISCNIDDCVVSGINDSEPATLLTLVSHDKGASWTYLQENIFPPFMKYPEINSVTFVNKTCVMLGNYRDNQNKDQLLFLVSKDGGNTWSGMPKIKDFPSKWRKNIRFDAMHCSGKNCFIAGSYDDQPMLLSSYDGAASWAMTKQENINDLPGFMESVRLSSLASTK